MKRVYDFARFHGAEIIVSPLVGDYHMVLRGKTQKLNPIGFRSPISIWNLVDGTITGNCEPSEVQAIYLSKKNKQVLEYYVSRVKKIKCY